MPRFCSARTPQEHRPCSFGGASLLCQDLLVHATIFRISGGDIVQTCEAFFRNEFLDHQVAHPGVWVGAEATRCNLRNPVGYANVYNVFNGQEPFDPLPLALPPKSLFHGAKETAGWKIVLSAGENLSARWALATATERVRFETAHAESVSAAVDCLERKLTEAWKIPLYQYAARPVFMQFQAGADADQSPNLHTSVLLPKIHHRRNSTIGFLKEISFVRERRVERANDEMERTYRQELGLRMRRELAREFPRISLRPEFPGEKKAGENHRLQSEFLFAEWRRLASEAGYGHLVNDSSRLRDVSPPRAQTKPFSLVEEFHRRRAEKGSQTNAQSNGNSSGHSH